MAILSIQEYAFDLFQNISIYGGRADLWDMKRTFFTSSRSWKANKLQTNLLVERGQFVPFLFSRYFYRTRVRSLAMLVSNSLTHSLTHSVTPSKLYWCDPGVWRCQLKTYWGCFCCWCWWWGSCWQQFVADLKLRFGHKAKLLFRLWAQGLVKILKLAADVWLRLRSWILVKILKLGLANLV